MEEHTKAALKGDDKNALAYEMRANLEIYNGQFTQAEADLLKSEQLDPANDHLLFSKGDLYFAKKDYGRALSMFTAYLDKHLKDIAALNRRLRTNNYLNNKLAAYDDAMKSLAIDSNLSFNQYAWIDHAANDAGIYYYQAKDLIKARAYFDQSIALHRLIQYKWPSLIDQLERINTYIQNRNSTYNAESGELLQALAAKDFPKALALLKAGANPNVYSSMDAVGTPLYPITTAIWEENPELVNALIKSGADVNVLYPKRGDPPLTAALRARKHRAEISLALLRAGANPELTDATGKTALAVLANDIGNQENTLLIKTLINDVKANLNSTDDFDDTPLDQATRSAAIAPMFYLAKAGAVRGAKKDAKIRSSVLIMIDSVLKNPVLSRLYDAGLSNNIPVVNQLLAVTKALSQSY